MDSISTLDLKYQFEIMVFLGVWLFYAIFSIFLYEGQFTSKNQYRTIRIISILLFPICLIGMVGGLIQVIVKGIFYLLWRLFHAKKS